DDEHSYKQQLNSSASNAGNSVVGENKNQQRRGSSSLLFSLCRRRGEHLPQLGSATLNGGTVAGAIAGTRDAAKRSSIHKRPFARASDGPGVAAVLRSAVLFLRSQHGRAAGIRVGPRNPARVRALTTPHLRLGPPRSNDAEAKRDYSQSAAEGLYREVA